MQIPDLFRTQRPDAANDGGPSPRAFDGRTDQPPLLVCIQVDPEMLQFVEVLNFPVPPDGVLDGAGRARRQGNFTGKRGRFTGRAEDGEADN